MPVYEVITCVPSAGWQAVSVIATGPANKISCITSDGQAGNLTAVQLVAQNVLSETGGDSLSGSLLNLSPESALLISGAVGLLWASAWVIREAVRYFRSDENVEVD